jgi:hypothetical protein
MFPFVESAVNEMIAKRMNKKQPMRRNRTTLRSILDIRTAVLNGNLEDDFRHRNCAWAGAYSRIAVLP